MRKLKIDKKKKSKMEIAYIAKVEFINTPNPYLLPLSGSFNFNLSFLILPDIISNNTPIPFIGNKGKWLLYKASCHHVPPRH